MSPCTFFISSTTLFLFTNSLPDFVAQNKALLQQHYVPAIEKKEVPKIESEDKPEPVQLTEEQLEERKRMFEEAKRRILGGKT